MLIQGTLDESNNVVIPSKPLVWVGDLSGGGGGGGGETEVTNWPANYPLPAGTTVGITGSVTATGPLTNAQLTAVSGTAAQTAVTTDPTAAGQTMLAVLRGILAEMQTQTALLNDIKTNTTPVGP